jgi:hypothetical protein
MPLPIKKSKGQLAGSDLAYEISLSNPSQGAVVAWYDATSSPPRAAVVDVPKGKGFVRIVGFEIGTAYTKTINRYDDRFRTGFNKAAGEQILRLPNAQKIQGPVVGALPGTIAGNVELVQVEKGGKEATVAINYTNHPSKPLTNFTINGFRITVPKTFRCAISLATDRKYPTTLSNNSSTISVDLGTIDVFAWLPTAC